MFHLFHLLTMYYTLITIYYPFVIHIPHPLAAQAAALQPAAEMELLRRLSARASPAPEMPEMPALAVVATFKVRRTGPRWKVRWMEDENCFFGDWLFLECFFFLNAFSIFGVFFSLMFGLLKKNHCVGDVGRFMVEICRGLSFKTGDLT